MGVIVMKFGGTSLQDAGCLERAASIVAEQADSGPLVVVSAVGQVTRRLLACGKLAVAGADGAARDELSAIGALHHEILEGLGSGASAGDTHDALERHLTDLSAVIDTISAAAEYPPRSQDAVISFGELLSATLFTAAARAAGLSAGAEQGELGGFIEGETGDDPRVGDGGGAHCEHAGDVGPDLDLGRFEGGAE